MNYHVELTPRELIYLELLLDQEIQLQSDRSLKKEILKNILIKLQQCTTSK